LLWLGIWTLAAVFWSAQNIVRDVVTGRPIRWLQAVGFEFLYWTPFALLTPFLLFMVRRFRLEPGLLRRNLSFHMAGAVVFAFAQTLIAFALQYATVVALKFPPESIDAMVANLRVAFWLVVITALWKYWVIIGLWYAFDYYRRYREREARASQLEARLATSQLQALKMQLQPHFLFNTLHSVSMLNLTDANAANRVLVKLSELLRITLDSNSSQEVPLEKEIDFLDRYLEIESIRFQDRLDVRFLFDDDVQDSLVPNLVLQPLVENAIRHGLEVADDGPGLPAGWSADRDTGLGLTNTRERLERLYGEGQQLEFESAPGGGLTVRITLPFRRAQRSASMQGSPDR
jgi:signal transduction histidine kinase